MIPKRLNDIIGAFTPNALPQRAIEGAITGMSRSHPLNTPRRLSDSERMLTALLGALGAALRPPTPLLLPAEAAC
jgi:hypothetical protein